MKMKWIVSVPLTLVLAVGASGQTLTLDQAVAAAQTGTDAAVVNDTLEAARALDAQARARAGLTVTSSLGWSAAKGINDPESPFKLGSSPTRATSPSSSSVADNLIPQQVSGAVTFATPMTSLALTGSQTFQFNPDGTLLNSTGAGGTLSQTLLTGYAGGASQASADKSALTWQSAQATARSNLNKAVLGVKTAFFTLVAAQDRATVSSQTLRQRQDALRFILARSLSGTATAYDVKVAQAAVRSAELDLAAAENGWATARQRLANLLSLPTSPELWAVASEPLSPAVSVDEAVENALRLRSEIQSAEFSARAAAVDLAVAQGAAVPTVVLTAGVNYSGSTTMTATETAATSALVGTVGVKVTPPAVDSGLAEAQGLQARSLRAVAQTQREQLLRSIPVDVRDAWATWQLNGQRLDLARTLVDNAEVNRQIVKSQFDAGAKPIADWLAAEVAYSTAQLNVITALLTWQQSAATLQNLMGQ